MEVDSQYERVRYFEWYNLLQNDPVLSLTATQHTCQVIEGLSLIEQPLSSQIRMFYLLHQHHKDCVTVNPLAHLHQTLKL